MKILFPCDPDGNPFVQTLAEEMRVRGHHVDQGVDFFWKGALDYDIVHFQWPNALFRWDDSAITPEGIRAVVARIDAHRKSGARLFLTRHNESPHWAKTAVLDLYAAVEGACGVVVHLGEASRVSAQALPHMARACHIVIPHHVYPGIDRSVNRLTARRHLKIGADERVLLAFGAFRNDDERLLALCAAHNQPKRTRLLAPRLFQFPVRFQGRFIWSEVRRRLRYLPYGIFQACPSVPDSELPQYFAAADIVLLQRLNTLNSGNLPMAFSFGRVVVGPDCGNMGPILRETGNPTFDPSSRLSVAVAVDEGFDLAAAGKGEENKSYAEEHWRVGQIVSSLLDEYDRKPLAGVAQ